MWPPSSQQLLAHALLDLFGKVGRVELCDRRHDVLDELTGDRIVNILDHGRQLNAVLGEQRLDRRVVVHVSGQAIDLVDEYDMRAQLGVADTRQQSLEGRPLRGLGGRAWLDELLRNELLTLVRIPAHRVELGGNGEIGLFVRGDTGIENAIHDNA